MIMKTISTPFLLGSSTLINLLLAEIKMKKLVLYDNDLGDDGASHISTCLSKIEELDIGRCKISAYGIKSISDAISKLPEPEHSLSNSCGQCALCGNHGKHINMVMKTTSTPPPMGSSTLINLLLAEIKMKIFDISGNKFGNDGASHISTCLRKIEELYIGWCKISASGIKSISDAISKLPEPMKKLDLYDNDLGDDGASHISTCLSKIEELHIGWCKISASGIKSISDAISKLPEPRKLPELYGFPRTLQLTKQEKFLKPLATVTYKRPRTLGNVVINFREVAHQTAYIKRKQSLFKPYGQCALCGNHGKHINMVMKTASTPSPLGSSTLINFLLADITMKWLSLYRNDLGDDGASHISTCLSKIEELNIGRCKISATGIKSISDAISKLPEPKPKVVGLDWKF
ncbi:unnamed protein product [Clavelina lepadiformis]|uniref:RNI-like protein n=1 Tax=Clavelina lepadiformis TaxID=159417 RepID=A0ABP0G9Q8_CLALP